MYFVHLGENPEDYMNIMGFLLERETASETTLKNSNLQEIMVLCLGKEGVQTGLRQAMGAGSFTAVLSS